jgi:hypothetical protein
MNTKLLYPILFILMMLTGCNAAVNIQGKVAGIDSGRFFYQDGNLVTEYKMDIDVVWRACEKTVTDLKATEIQKERKISGGMIEAVIDEDKVTIKVEYLGRDSTSVSISVGATGNNMASRLIQDRISDNMTKR